MTGELAGQLPDVGTLVTALTRCAAAHAANWRGASPQPLQMNVSLVWL